MLIFWIFILIVSLVFLIKASDYFIESAECIGISINIPPVIIGATIIALGTSLPELISSIIAVCQNASEFVAGNVIGSNVTNILLILGVSGVMFKNFVITYKNLMIDIVILLFASIALVFSINDHSFGYIEGIIFVFFLVVYLVYLFNFKDPAAEENNQQERIKATLKTYLVLLFSGVFIYLGAKYTIEAVIVLSEMLHIGKEIIAITAVALGTSLPELLVSLTALKKGKSDLVIGNIIGSNIFNTLAIMGIPSFFGQLVIPESIIGFAIPAMLCSCLVLTLFVLDKKVTRLEGILLLVFYVCFLVVLFLDSSAGSALL